MSNLQFNPYEVLGVDRNADDETIKKSYRRKAVKCHPDKNPGNKEAEDEFKILSSAYDILSTPEKRNHYDRYGTIEMHDGGSHYTDIFDSIFNIRSSGSQYMNPDIKLSYQISIKQAIQGGKVKFGFNRNVACEYCNGMGYNLTQNRCSYCGGRGMIHNKQGFLVMAMHCSYCGGTGRQSTPCEHCHGNVYSSVSENITVNIPSGISRRAALRVPDKGNSINFNGKKMTGNLYLVIDYPSVEKGVSLDNGNIYCSIHVPYYDVMSESNIEIDILGCRKLNLKLDSSKHSGYQYVIPKAGATESHVAFVKVYIDLPKKDISEEDKSRLMSLLGEIYGGETATFQPSEF